MKGILLWVKMYLSKSIIKNKVVYLCWIGTVVNCTFPLAFINLVYFNVHELLHRDPSLCSDFAACSSPWRCCLSGTYQTDSSTDVHKKSPTVKLRGILVWEVGVFDIYVCVCVHVGVWGLFVFLFQHMIYSVCLPGSLCEHARMSAVMSLC